MKKILFGITSLTLGGAERVLVDIANALADKYEITIFTIYAGGELEKQLNKKVKLKSLYNNSYEELSSFQKHVLMPLKVLLQKNEIYQKKIKDNYEVEIAFLEGPITRLFSSKNNQTRKLVWVHNDIKQVFGKGIKARIKKKIDEKFYNQYEKIIFVSKDNLEEFNQVYPNIIKPKEVIYNYLDSERILEKAEEKVKLPFQGENINFLTVTRLVEQKAIDRIIRVHKRLIENGFLHHFYVVGDGPEREKIQKLIKENQLENTFFLLGKKENPYPYIKNADCFCLLSKFEGYGMAIDEAKILNRPILITNTAAREAVADYKDAKIVENSEKGIYEGLKETIENTKNKSLEMENKKYENKEILDEIINLLEEKRK